ncbi:MAG: DNA-directed RNA polymerase subunit H [Candidatus Altiarchaeales archaeon]|nr:DNA-directed RNA polymerase subunit H [Candidatus Altiarchaeales archaeon]MBD3415781.1 DNA-directed RNA polymerase subunit H [Candidatus Altiarchaeales archaeon]
MLIEHKLVPKHELMSPEESQAVLEKYKVTRDQMPKIRANDPGIKHLQANVGDLIRISRVSEYLDNYESYYYRVVVE